MPAPRFARRRHEARRTEPSDSLADARSCRRLASLAAVMRHDALSHLIRSLTLAHEASTRAMSRTVRAVPRTVPVTFERVPDARGAYATSTSWIRQPARAARPTISRG